MLSATPGRRRGPAARRAGAGCAAFTLTELLAVLAIVSVLAALLLVVLGRVRASARDSACLSNLRAVHQALNLHANDHRGRWPEPQTHGSAARFVPVRWVGADGVTRNGALDPYVDDAEAMKCPAVAANGLMNAGELQYWYGTQAVSPDPRQTERAGSNDPFPSLAWCMWPNVARIEGRGGVLHHGGTTMHVLGWAGGVAARPADQWRSGGHP